jgi:beta-carotene hydroxylase
MESNIPYTKPTIHELGTDLLKLSVFNTLVTIVTPLVFFALYFVFAYYGLWIVAVICTVIMSFFTYGSTSHDLVHMNLKINKNLNEFLLTFIELVSMRSGHAYRFSHLNHHQRFPHEDDLEGAAAKMSLVRSLLEGIIFQSKLYFWALKQSKGKPARRLMILEGVLVVVCIGLSIFSAFYTPIFIVYTGLIIIGSWIIPLVTSYLVHNPDAEDELHQTRLFRGRFFSFIAFEHLYHLEHHMYPMVPHKNWVKLSKRLDPHFEQQGIKPVKLI